VSLVHGANPTLIQQPSPFPLAESGRLIISTSLSRWIPFKLMEIYSRRGQQAASAPCQSVLACQPVSQSSSESSRWPSWGLKSASRHRAAGSREWILLTPRQMVKMRRLIRSSKQIRWIFSAGHKSWSPSWEESFFHVLVLAVAIFISYTLSSQSSSAI